MTPAPDPDASAVGGDPGNAEPAPARSPEAALASGSNDTDRVLPERVVPSDEAAWARAARAAADDEQEQLTDGFTVDAPEADQTAPPTRAVPRVVADALVPGGEGVAPTALDPEGRGADPDVEAVGGPGRDLDPVRQRDTLRDVGPAHDEAPADEAHGVGRGPDLAAGDQEPAGDGAVVVDANETDDAEPEHTVPRRPVVHAGPVHAGPVGADVSLSGPDDAEPGPAPLDHAVLDHAVVDQAEPQRTEPHAAAEAGRSDGEPDGGAHPDRTPPVLPSTDAWRVLGRSLRPRATRAQVLAGLLCGMLGFAVVVQVRQTHDEGLSTLRQSELVGILDQTTRQGDELEREADSLERTRQKLLSGSTSSQAALDAAKSSAATQGILAGRLPAEGPGLSITVGDPGGGVTARSLLNLLEELRNAGAEAVQLNDLRITASSYIVEGEGGRAGVVVDDVVVEPPYRWLVIGDPATMGNAMEIPGGAFATIRNEGGRPSAVQQDELSILATRTVPEPRFATPVPPAEG